MNQFAYGAGAIFRVTDRLGIDLAAAIRSDALQPQQLSEMMRACDTCWKSQRCARWVQQSRGAKALAMPDFCASHAVLNSLTSTRSNGRTQAAMENGVTPLKR